MSELITELEQRASFAMNAKAVSEILRLRARVAELIDRNVKLADKYNDAADKVVALTDELIELKARSCTGCSRYLANQYHEGIGACGYLEIDVESYFCCNKWEPKT